MANDRLLREARHLVVDWALRLERLESVGSSKHPLLRLRERARAVAGPRGGVVYGSEQTAHGVETRATRGAVTLVAPELEPREIDRIMIAVDEIATDYRRALYLITGLGLGEREAALALQVSRSRVREWHSGGLAAVCMALMTRHFRR